MKEGIITQSEVGMVLTKLINLLIPGWLEYSLHEVQGKYYNSKLGLKMLKMNSMFKPLQLLHIGSKSCDPIVKNVEKKNGYPKMKSNFLFGKEIRRK